MEARPVRELRRGEIEDAPPGAIRDEVHEAEHVLVGVAEAHTAADPRLVEARRAGEVEGGHALVLGPRVQHPLRVRLGALDLEVREQAEPPCLEHPERGVDRAGLGVAGEQPPSLLLVHDAGPLELRLRILFDVGEDEREGLLAAGLEPQVELMRADRVPAVHDAPLRPARERDGRLVQTVVHSDERVA